MGKGMGKGKGGAWVRARAGQRHLFEEPGALRGGLQAEGGPRGGFSRTGDLDSQALSARVISN